MATTKEDIGSWFGKNIGTILSILAMVISFAVANDRVNTRVDSHEKRIALIEQVGTEQTRNTVARVERLEQEHGEARADIREINTKLDRIEKRLGQFLCKSDKSLCEVR